MCAEKCDAPASQPCTTSGRNKHKGGAVKCPNSTSTCIGHRENLQNILFRVVKHHETSQMENPLDGTFISLPTPIEHSPAKFQTSMLLHLLHALACVWQCSLFKLHQCIQLEKLGPDIDIAMGGIPQYFQGSIQ